MWTIGDDFQYQYVESWFKQMDKFIHYVNKAVIYLDGDGCKLRSGLVKIEEGLTLDTLIAYDSCDLCKMTLMHHLCKRDLFCASDECLCTSPMSAGRLGIVDNDVVELNYLQRQGAMLVKSLAAKEPSACWNFSLSF
ncbi:uncharacterized protein LOC131241519 [Magnolia sinica]|uniref:uncharacterized protein LOC131241519 n=1 Tax=Magnolia sinica TaxID=86752 RepID=UPI00265ADA7B|nr:uncharacterized protein LOC131241519 [Magnolia sinica]